MELDKFEIITLENFKKLPERCKDLFFEYYVLTDEINTYLMVYDFNYSECKSPIEILFKFAFDTLYIFNLKEFSKIQIYSQVEIKNKGKKYIVDFIMEYPDDLETDYQMIIECDGHEYHSTKEQIEKDHERQNILEDAGYGFIRFSGTELYKDPIKCAKTAIKKFIREAELRRGQTWKM